MPPEILYHRHGFRDLKRKVIALLDQVFPEYEKLFSDTFGVSSMELLSQYTTPEEMLSVSSQQLAEVLEKASRGRLGAEKAVEIQDAAKNSVPSSIMRKFVYKSDRTPSAQGRGTCP